MQVCTFTKVLTPQAAEAAQALRDAVSLQTRIFFSQGILASSHKTPAILTQRRRNLLGEVIVVARLSWSSAKCVVIHTADAH